VGGIGGYMKILYGHSLVEGAPYGNKNAAGKHKKGGIAHIAIEKDTPFLGTHVTVVRGRGSKNRAKVYQNVSAKRAQQVINAAGKRRWGSAGSSPHGKFTWFTRAKDAPNTVN